MGVPPQRPTDDPTANKHLYQLDLARWWELLTEHLAHPSADATLLELLPDRRLTLRSGWDWAGIKGILDQTMAVATTQLLTEIAPPPAEQQPLSGDD